MNIEHSRIYINNVVISVCLLACLSDHNSAKPLGRFTSNFDWGTRETHWNVLIAWY